jgi:hypothetical protein
MGEVVPVTVIPPGLDVTTYPVIVVPPLFAGATNETLAELFPEMALTPVGGDPVAEEDQLGMPLITVKTWPS